MSGSPLTLRVNREVITVRRMLVPSTAPICRVGVNGSTGLFPVAPGTCLTAKVVEWALDGAAAPPEQDERGRIAA